MSSVTYGFALSLLLITSSWIWLQLDSNQTIQKQKGEVWGEIYERDNQVYINTSPQSFWQIARSRTFLSSEKVQIQSLNAAFLSILLQKKGRLEISENSNVIIHIAQNTKKRFVCEIELIEGDMYMSFFGQTEHLCHVIWRGQKISSFKNADITLNKSSSQLNIHTHRGLVTFADSDRELSNSMWAKVGPKGTQLFEDDFFVLTPLANDKVYQSKKGRVRFKWAHTPKDSQLQLFVGSKKNNLKPVWKNPTDKDQGYFRFPLGTYYWQLIANQGQKQYKSQIYKIFIRPQMHPVLVFPSLGSTKFVSLSKKETYQFAWLNQSRLESLFIEISKDINFSTIILKKPVGEFGFIEFLNIFPEGQYFWRVSGFRHNSSDLLKSHVRHFFVTDKNTQFKKISSWPRDRERINRWDLYWKESKFIWDAFSGFQNIRISITNLHSQFVQYLPVNITKNRIDIPLLDLGFYEWKLQGESQAGKNLWVDITEPKKITVTTSPSIDWQEAMAIDRQLSWTDGPSNTDHYMIRIRQYQLLAGSKSSQIIIRKTRNNRWTVPSTFTDFLSIKIMAMDSSNQVIALSPEKDFTFNLANISLKRSSSSLNTAIK